MRADLYRALPWTSPNLPRHPLTWVSYYPSSQVSHGTHRWEGLLGRPGVRNGNLDRHGNRSSCLGRFSAKPPPSLCPPASPTYSETAPGGPAHTTFIWDKWQVLLAFLTGKFKSSVQLFLFLIKLFFFRRVLDLKKIWADSIQSSYVDPTPHPHGFPH